MRVFRISKQSIFLFKVYFSILLYISIKSQINMYISGALWLMLIIILYFFLAQQLLKSKFITPSQHHLIEESQWLLFVYVLFRFSANLLAVRSGFMGFSYLIGLIALIVPLWALAKQRHSLQTFLQLATLGIISLIIVVGLECCVNRT